MSAHIVNVNHIPAKSNVLAHFLWKSTLPKDSSDKQVFEKLDQDVEPDSPEEYENHETVCATDVMEPSAIKPLLLQTTLEYDGNAFINGFKETVVAKSTKRLHNSTAVK